MPTVLTIFKARRMWRIDHKTLVRRNILLSAIQVRFVEDLPATFIQRLLIINTTSFYTDSPPFRHSPRINQTKKTHQKPKTIDKRLTCCPAEYDTPYKQPPQSQIDPSVHNSYSSHHDIPCIRTLYCSTVQRRCIFVRSVRRIPLLDS